MPSSFANSRARTSFGNASSSAASVSRSVAFMVFGELVQAVVQASEGVGVFPVFSVVCESSPDGSHPRGRGFEPLSAHCLSRMLKASYTYRLTVRRAAQSLGFCGMFRTIPRKELHPWLESGIPSQRIARKTAAES